MTKEQQARAKGLELAIQRFPNLDLVNQMSIGLQIADFILTGTVTRENAKPVTYTLQNPGS